MTYGRNQILAISCGSLASFSSLKCSSYKYRNIGSAVNDRNTVIEKREMEKSSKSSASSDDQQLVPHSELQQSHLSSVVYDLSQQVQVAMESMLKMTTEIEHTSAGISEDMEKCKDNVLERKKNLEEEKENFQKAAYAVLDMFNNQEIS